MARERSEQHASDPGSDRESAGRSDKQSDFDLLSLFQGPAAMMSGAIGVADNARKTFAGVVDTIASLQRAAAALEQIASRLDRLVSDLEAPVRVLAPELEKAAVRVQRLADAFDGPIERLLPGLENAIDTFDRIGLAQLPESLEQLRAQLVGMLDAVGEVPRMFTGLLPGLGKRSVSTALTPAPTATSASTIGSSSSNAAGRRAKTSTANGAPRTAKTSTATSVRDQKTRESKAKKASRTSKEQPPSKTRKSRK